MKEINGYALRDALADAIDDCTRQYLLADDGAKIIITAKIAGLRHAMSIAYAMIGDEPMAELMRQDTEVA